MVGRILVIIGTVSGWVKRTRADYCPEVIAGVAQRAKARGIPVVALAGSVEANAEEELRSLGLSVALSIVQQPLPLETAMNEGYRLLSEASERVMRLVSLWPS